MGRVNRSKDKLRSLGILGPALVPNPLTGLIRVALKFDILGERAVNVWWLKFDHNPTDEEMATVAALLAASYGANVMPLVSHQCSLIGLSVTDWSTTDRATIEDDFAEPIEGGDLGSVNTTFDALSVKLRTGRVGRAFLGFKRIAGIPDVDQIDGRVPTVALSNWQAAFNDLKSDSESWDAVLGVVSFFKNNAARATPIFTALTSFDVLSAITSQVTRKFGRGE